MANLYEINQEILSCVDTETGEILNEEKINSLEMDLHSKIEGLACWVKNLESDAFAYKVEKDTFAARQKAAENKAASIKQYLSNFLDGQAFETLRVKVSFRRSEVLEISDDAVIPMEYLRIKEPEVNKTDLKKAIKGGLKIDGVKLEEHKNIQIR